MCCLWCREIYVVYEKSMRLTDKSVQNRPHRNIVTCCDVASDHLDHPQICLIDLIHKSLLVEVWIYNYVFWCSQKRYVAIHVGFIIYLLIKHFQVLLKPVTSGPTWNSSCTNKRYPKTFIGEWHELRKQNKTKTKTKQTQQQKSFLRVIWRIAVPLPHRAHPYDTRTHSLKTEEHY